MLLRRFARLALFALCILLPLALSGCAGLRKDLTQTPTEHGANLYAANEMDSIPRHDNLPDYSLAPEELTKARHLSTIDETLHFVDEAWGIVSLLLLLQLRIFARMRNKAVSLSTNRWVQGFAFLLFFLIANLVLNLPLSIYSHHLSRAYGLSVQGWGSWLGDAAKSFALEWIIGGLLLMLLFWVIRTLPRSWWFAFWLCSIPIVLLGVFAAPYVEPIFNHYEPLAKTNPVLVNKLEEVVQKGHMDIPPDRMFLMKASEKVTTINADVEGFGHSKRVVVWDTTVQKMTPDEILFVFGHESGHYVLHHIVHGVVFTFALLLVLFYAGYRFVRWAIRRYGLRWRIDSQADWAALGVLLLAFSLFGLITEPIENSFSRTMEHAADVYGQEAVHGLVVDPQTTAVNAFNVLGRTSFADPNPSALYEFWTYSHPAIGRRAAFAKFYDPWAPDAAPKYFKAGNRD